MKKAMIVILSILGVLIVVGAGGVFYITNGLEAGENLAINPVDLTAIEDGTYAGVYQAGRWSNEVAVSVADHQIANIAVVKTVTIDDPEMTSTIINNVIKNQSTTVDTVSGATVTSKAYLKSIENALTQ
ncbi:MAG: FMN-binding protein [Acetobacterium sp.]|nr:FMN-binding protein [Acetobacterium sp.]